MTLDIAMGGSTNTVLHLLAAASEAGVPFTMRDIDRLSRRVPNICKVAPSTATVHVEDVHRAGGVFGILAELDRGGLMHRGVPTVHAATMGEGIDHWDVRARPGSGGDPLLFRRAGRHPHHRAVQPGRALPQRGSGPREGRRPRHFATPSAPMAAWRCSTATSPRTAAS